MRTPEIYRVIHEKVILKSDGETIQWNKLLSCLGETFHIPKDKRIKVINEMQELGLIKKLNKFSVRVN